MSTKLAAVAHSHLGEAGPTDTCLQAINRWVAEAGGRGIGTDSVTAAQAAAEQGRAGWTYHAGTDGLRVGDVVDWAAEALGSANDRHVSVVTDLQGSMVRSIGSGGPTQRVAYQPQSGGFNPLRTFRGYFRIDLTPPAPAAPAKTPPAKVQPAKAPARAGTYVVARGDDLWGIAERHGTTVARLLKANPPADDHRTKDYSIIRANLILVGQRLHLP